MAWRLPRPIRASILLFLAAPMQGTSARAQEEHAEGAPPPGPRPVAPAAGERRTAVRATEPIDGMVFVPGGRFWMGSAEKGAPANERPPRRRTIGPFWIDRNEVTVAGYRTCVGAGVCSIPGKNSPNCTFEGPHPARPVNCVRWREAATYCGFVGKRLPREIEWEFAARGTEPIRFPWGNGPPHCELAVTLVREGDSTSCGRNGPQPIGGRTAGKSPFGVLDLSGNLEEWTSDWYTEFPAEGAAPQAGSAYVLRGGGWQSPPSQSRATSRNWGSALEAGANVGFRCARDEAPRVGPP